MSEDATPSPWYSARMHELLHSDDVAQWKQEFPEPGRTLTDWMLDNVLHAIQACPNVMAFWNEQTPKQHYHGVLHHCLAGALDGLDDGTKIRVLQGYGEDDKWAQAKLAVFIGSRQFDWRLLSPAWVGHPGSDLRAQAVHMGWSSDVLAGQVVWALRRPSSVQWRPWVPYPHSLAVLHRYQCAKQLIEREGRLMEPMALRIMPWVGREDLALAHALAQKAPLDIQYRLDMTDVNSQQLLEDDVVRLRALVEMHAGLGLWEELSAGIVQGKIPDYGVYHGEQLNLPELDMNPPP